ncbi:Uu.00g038420.m01.CDS01 [Anthostomella pinea]|uniref:Uu.00g038420.m01.CDS01 n=1 Tax=Anthostomella pinea TaxID=933095 RepID=A0AAI8V9T4_9PEZI|nr:Uu.00g038420.m01.CDS01 [Anthostomella pinea]
MLSLALLLVLSFGRCAQNPAKPNPEHYAPVAVASNHKRQAMTCEQTYGPETQQCGGVTSTFCYDPSIGQTCCPLDNGFCDEGEYCAPVAGYCCLEGEDLPTCAENAGFVLPGSASISPTTSVSMFDDATTIAPDPTVSPFLNVPPTSTTMSMPDGIPSTLTTAPTSTRTADSPDTNSDVGVDNDSAADADAADGTGMPMTTSSITAPAPAVASNTTTLPPFVQVSVAVKGDRLLCSAVTLLGVFFTGFF